VATRQVGERDAQRELTQLPQPCARFSRRSGRPDLRRAPAEVERVGRADVDGGLAREPLAKRHRPVLEQRRRRAPRARA
jgi:hypothetical protein